MKKTNIDEYMKRIEEEAIRSGIEYNPQPKDENEVKNFSDVGFLQSLETDAMLSDDAFSKLEEKLNIDWGHIRKVMEVSDEKYGNDYIRNNTTVQEHRKLLQEDKEQDYKPDYSKLK